MEVRAVLRSFAIGVTCGLRSMTGPAVVSWRAREPARLAVAALAAGELIADKLPGTPARTVAPALLFRALSGGFCGRRVARVFGEDVVSGTLAGAAGGIAGAFFGQALRARIVAWSRLPDPFIALAEDAAAIAGAIASTGKAPKNH